MQQMRVVATYADGDRATSPREAFVASGNSEVAEAVEDFPAWSPRSAAARRPSSRATRAPTPPPRSPSMGDRSGFAWSGSAGVQPDRRAGRREVAADEDPPLRDLQRHRIPPPRLPRPHRPAADGRAGAAPSSPTLADSPVKARRAHRRADRQPRVRRLLDRTSGRTCCR